MFDVLKNVFDRDRERAALAKDEVAALLKISSEALDAFEAAYKKQVLDDSEVPDNLFQINAKKASEIGEQDQETMDEKARKMADRIVDELLPQAEAYTYDGSKAAYEQGFSLPEHTQMVTNEDVLSLPEALRPQLTGFLMKKDIKGDSYPIILSMYKDSLNEKFPPKRRMQGYHLFRQGLDILDLDPITYEIIGMNPNSMGHWLPKLVYAVQKQDFFKIPKTTVIKVPLTLLQLTRNDYFALTPTTKYIVDQFCMKAFHLDESEEYFIKTGTYSSKFDFRNAHVHGAKEVRELGEYLLYIHFQALQMASPLCKPVIYGVSTTNEWVVREFIKDTENNPCIYKGLPLHTEYRLFVDFDTNEVIGMSPYWEPKIMKQRFAHEDDADSPHQIHDYIIYQMHETVLIDHYEKNKAMVKKSLERILPDIDLSGQWSIDIMQNGDDFYIIDMALAANSALKECVPPGLLKPVQEKWIPKLPDLTAQD